MLLSVDDLMARGEEADDGATFARDVDDLGADYIKDMRLIIAPRYDR